MARRACRLLLCLLIALAPACIRPTGWDARTNGGRYDPGPDDPAAAGQPGVDDMRSRSQNDLAVSWGD